jgi:hypothetical protein
MLYLIDIVWIRRSSEPDRPDSGTTTYAEFARTLTGAKRKAAAKFRRHYGMHLILLNAREQPDPAGLYQGSAGVSPASSH